MKEGIVKKLLWWLMPMDQHGLSNQIPQSHHGVIEVNKVTIFRVTSPLSFKFNSLDTLSIF